MNSLIQFALLARRSLPIDVNAICLGVSARPVLVYDGEFDPEVEGEGYFDAIIPASKLIA